MEAAAARRKVVEVVEEVPSRGEAAVGAAT
jgi:hypothetical protein